MQQHPFSIASHPSDKRIELTMKELGDFTRSGKDITPGTRAWLEGPYGCFHLDSKPWERAVFIAGGVGITPIMSMLRDARHRGGKVPYLLFDGNTSWDDVMFREEIEEMSSAMPLEVVHVLTEPPEDWKGETGYIDREVLERHLPAGHEKFVYFICGPGALLDMAEPVLRQMGVPATAIYTERFDMV